MAKRKKSHSQFGIASGTNDALRAAAMAPRADGRSAFPINGTLEQGQAYLAKYPNPALAGYGKSPDYDWFRADSAAHPGKYSSNFLQDALDIVVAAPLTYVQEQAQKQSEAIGALVVAASSTAGKAVGTVTDATATAFKGVADLAAQVPIIGAPLHGVIVIASGPFTLTAAIANGERIDQAVLDDFKRNLGAVKEVAPLARTIISFVPGIGTGINGAIAAGLALAEGESLSDALIVATKNMLPGGPLAAAAFEVAYNVSKGDNVLTTSFNAAMAQLPPTAQKAFNVLQRAAKGENIPLAAMEEARDMLPDYARPAMDVGIAIGHGKRLQDIALDAVKDISTAGLNILVDQGKVVITNSPVYTAGANLVEKTEQTGYALGLGLLANSGVSPQAIYAIRDKLDEYEKKGFDLALAAHAGRVVATAPDYLPNDAKAAYYAARGLVGNEPDVKANMVASMIANNPISARLGVSTAIVDVNKLKNSPVSKVLAVVRPVFNPMIKVVDTAKTKLFPVYRDIRSDVLSLGGNIKTAAKESVADFKAALGF